MSRSPKDDFEEVFTVVDYWDGPREGIANFGGSPHFYRCIFDEQKDEYSDRFRLAPVSKEAFRLAMEDWAIWKRWLEAYQQGAVSIESHPALPKDRQRHDEISRILQSSLVVDENCAIRRGEFVAVADDPDEPSSARKMRVRWSDPK